MEYNHIIGDIPKEAPLGKILNRTDFRFQRLTISGIDNEPILSKNAPNQREEEIILFHKGVQSGDIYLERLADRIYSAIHDHTPLPVVRFADGEYEFYDGSMKCNGLYQQAESIKAIRSAIPSHIDSIRKLAATGIMAPLIHPGNVRRESGLLSLFKKKARKDIALRFLEFLNNENIALTEHNYIPFYAVYACLSSLRFAHSLNGKTVCIVNSDFNKEACAAWFESAGSFPNIVHVPISESYVATRWDSMREEVFSSVTEKPDCFLIGAGVGALQICVDAAHRFSVPAIDAGHILNMMNDMECKSQGPRLFTFQR